MSPAASPHGAGSLSWRRKLTYSLIPLLLLGASLELGFRAFPHRDRGKTRSGIVEPDPDLIWRLKPQATGTGVTNELGFRDTPIDVNATHRILLLGDSVSWCDSVSDLRHCFPYRLERELEARTPSQRVEIINTGVPGYSTFQQLRYLELRGLALEPDAILLQFCLNDVTERYRTVAAYGGDNTFLGVDTRHALRGLGGWLLRSSRAFEVGARFLQDTARDRETYRVGKLASPHLPQELEAAWQLTLGELAGIQRLTQERELPFLIAITPYRFQLSAPSQSRQPQDRLIAWARESGVAHVDLLPIFARQQDPRGLFLDTNHFSPRGHQIAAEALLEPVERELLESSRARRSTG